MELRRTGFAAFIHHRHLSIYTVYARLYPARTRAPRFDFVAKKIRANLAAFVHRRAFDSSAEKFEKLVDGGRS